MTTRHLVIGGTGFIGSRVALDLAREGHEVIIAARNPPSSPELAGFEYRQLDLAQCDNFRDFIADVHVIHHYAWATVPGSAAANPLYDLEAHVRPTVALLLAARALERKRLVFASSGGTVYGQLDRIPARESDLAKPMSAYGAAKLAVESYMRVFHRSGELDCRVARIANPYGLGATGGQEQGLLSIFARKALAGEPLVVWGDGEIIRDFIHISDLSSALRRLALINDLGVREMPIINIGTGVGISVNEVIERLRSQLRIELNPTYTASRTFDVPVNVLDITLARAALGWTPLITVEAGLALLIAELNERRLSSAPLPGADHR